MAQRNLIDAGLQIVTSLIGCLSGTGNAVGSEAFVSTENPEQKDAEEVGYQQVRSSSIAKTSGSMAKHVKQSQHGEDCH